MKIIEKKHQSIKQIEKNRKSRNELVLTPVTDNFLNKQINILNVKKSLHGMMAFLLKSQS